MGEFLSYVYVYVCAHVQRQMSALCRLCCLNGTGTKLGWTHHLLELRTGDAYNRGELGVDSTRWDGRELSATG